MRKYFALMFMLLISGCTNSVNKTEFVNPIFNQPLQPSDIGEGEVYLTPISIDMRTPKDKNLVAGKGKCELIENTQNKITLKCAVKWVESLTYEDAQRLLKKKESWSQELGRDISKRLSPDYSEDWYFSYKIKEHQYSKDYICVMEYSWLSKEPEYKSSSPYCIYNKSALSKSD